MTLRPRVTALVAALLTLASFDLLRAQDITSKDLLDGLANPSRWLTYSGDYTGRRFSRDPGHARESRNWFAVDVPNRSRQQVRGDADVVDGVLYDRPQSRVGHRRETGADSSTTSAAAAGLKGCCGMVNRGSLSGDRFNWHLILRRL